MIFDRLLRQRQARKKSEERFREYASRQEEFYQGMPESPSDEMATRRQVVSFCEQMLDLSREIDDARVEYDLVTSYLNDIQIIEELPDDERKPITNAATNIINLHRSKEEFYKADRKITESQYVQMQQVEDEIETVMNRFENNETYLDTVNRDLHYLEGEKMEWDIVRQECSREQVFLRRFSIVLLILFVIGVIAIFVVGEVFQLNVQLEFLGLLFAAALLGAYILFKFQDNSREIRRCEKNRNYAVVLENRAKMKYVNVKSAVDYTCAKYQVKNSKELRYIYEAYLEVVREQDRLRKMNEDMAYYENRLISMLDSYKIKDSESWIGNAAALVDNKEMVEIKHSLFLRRKKLRDRIAYNIDALKKLKNLVEINLDSMDAEDREQIQEIVDRIREVNQKLI